MKNRKIYFILFTLVFLLGLVQIIIIFNEKTKIYRNNIINNNAYIINAIIELSEKYIYNRNRPDKDIDILDEVCSKTSIKKDYNTSTIENNLELIQKNKKNAIKLL